LRKQIQNDNQHFYTYSKEHLSLSFPLVNENEIKMREKAENESKWKTNDGFKNVFRAHDYGEIPKKPDPAKMDDLTIPYVE